MTIMNIKLQQLKPLALAGLLGNTSGAVLAAGFKSSLAPLSVGKDGEKPVFYVSEQSQQSKFTCAACEEFNEIIGHYGYCLRCGTRNDIEDFTPVEAAWQDMQ